MHRWHAIAAGLAASLLAACIPGQTIDPETFPGGIMHVAYSGAPAEIVLFVNPDASLAGAEGVASVDGWSASRAALGFSAVAQDGAGTMVFDMPAAAFGPDFAGTVTLDGGCGTDCVREATAWWVRGDNLVQLPR